MLIGAPYSELTQRKRARGYRAQKLPTTIFPSLQKQSLNKKDTGEFHNAEQSKPLKKQLIPRKDSQQTH